MYNESLANRILIELDEAFPNKLQSDELRDLLPDFCSVPEREWAVAVDALIKLGYATGKSFPAGLAQVPMRVAANLEITQIGRQKLAEAEQAVGDPGGLDDLLPLFAKRQFVPTLRLCPRGPMRLRHSACW